jgi:toxin ParE1/3/4
VARFKLTPDALNDLRDIARYTEHQWGREQRNQYLAEIDKRFHWLAQSPKLATERDDIKPGYRCFPQGRHVIFFRERDTHIEILGILHRNMDVRRHL